MEKIDDILRQATDSKKIAGVVAMAANRGGIIYQGAFGRRSLDADAPMTMDTVFWIASMTKALTATACLQLVESGRIDLDAPAGKILPALADPKILTGFDADGKPLLRPARGTVTLRNLLTHTSGFAYDTWNADQLRFVRQSGIPRHITFTDPAACLPLAFDPGTAWEYGVGIDWAGKMVEAVSGLSLDDYLQKKILAPLGMADTGFLVTDRVRGRMAGQHTRNADGTLASAQYDAPIDPAMFTGGGGLFSTAADYMRFMLALLHGGAPILKPETVALMGRNHIGDIDVGPLKTFLPKLSNDVELFPGIPKKWGLSFLLNTRDVPGRRRAGTLTWAGLRNTYYWIDPTAKIAGLILTQMLPFGDHAVLDLYDAFETEIYR